MTDITRAKSGGDLTQADLNAWMEEETIQVTKATDLRIRELTHTITQYASGEIEPEKALDQIWRYRKKWGEALPHSQDDEVLVTLQDMRVFLDREITALAKAAGERTKELAHITVARAADEISAEEAGDRLYQHKMKWGEALPGVAIAQGMPDSEITAKVEKIADHADAQRRERLFKGRGERPGTIL